MVPSGDVTAPPSAPGRPARTARLALQKAVEYANQRVQFKEALAEFELTKKKIAYMAAHTFAMEATTAQCAAFIDRGWYDAHLRAGRRRFRARRDLLEQELDQQQLLDVDFDEL